MQCQIRLEATLVASVGVTGDWATFVAVDDFSLSRGPCEYNQGMWEYNTGPSVLLLSDNDQRHVRVNMQVADIYL